MDALVFVHGYLGGGAQWSGQVAHFANRFRVLTPDLPGFGDRVGEIAPDRIGDFAHAVLSDLSDQGVERFHLVGHSMGGMIVQDMVRLAPGRVRRLVLYGTGPTGELPGRFETVEISKQRASEDGVDQTARRISATWFLDGDQSPSYPLCANLAINVSLETM